MAEVIAFPQLALEFPAAAPHHQPPDAAARADALDIQRSFIVEAPAGSGKTALLIQRFLKLLAHESVTAPEQVLAITFTRKATAELRDRVLSHLESARAMQAGSNSSSFTGQTDALALAVLERDRQLGWSLLDHPYRLNIHTIDAVCAEIARTLPVLSGSGGRLAPTEDGSALHREAARRTLLLLGSGDAAFDTALRDLLLHRDGNLSDCEALIASMLSRRDQWASLVPFAQAELQDDWLNNNLLRRIEQALDHAIRPALERLVQLFPADLLARVAELAAELGPLEEYNGESSPLSICTARTNPPEAVSADLDHWRALIHLLVAPSAGSWRIGFKVNHLGCKLQRHQKEQLKAIIDQIRHRDDLLDQINIVRGLPSASYPAEQWAVAKSLFRVLSRALAELQLVFAERDQCDFTELTLLARQALKAENGPDDLAAALGARLQHLLVDEMQDTSTSQYEILELLTRSWDGYSQSVFLVGDPRQSIYLFRQARVERFLSALDSGRLGQLPLTRLRLTANFRSQGNLVDQFNAGFELIFPRIEGSVESPIAYTRADATLPGSGISRGMVWHATPLPAPRTSAATGSARRQHASEILSIANDWLSRPLPPDRKTIRDHTGSPLPEPWRVAVLVRSRPHLEEIVSAIHLFNQERPPSRRIPVRAVEIDPLSRRQEILDLTALTRALLHPADRAASFAVLRAPWCGLPLADLHILAGADDPSLRDHSLLRLVEERASLLGADSRRRLQRVSGVLRTALAQRARLTAAQLVERAWRSLGGDAWLNETQLTNVRRFLELLDMLQAESESRRIEPDTLAQRLTQLFAEADAIPPHTACLELLTIHKAKGLEWDVVLIPALERSPGRNAQRLLTWSEVDPYESLEEHGDDAAPVLLAPIAAKGDDADELTRWLNRMERDREAAERKRLFYVACTRARQELHLFAAPELSLRGEVNRRYDSLLAAAWPSAERHFAPPDEPHIAPAAPQPAVLALAAAATPTKRIVERVPPGFDPADRLREAQDRRPLYASTEPEDAFRRTRFSRPEGSFAARSLGNAVHACLDALAACMRSGANPAALLAELPSWSPRIAALLRADGLPANILDRLTRDARAALEKALRDPDGLWLLAPHPGSCSEFALTAWPNGPEPSPQGQTSIRIDRLFDAGAAPHALGNDYLWVVDYKTSGHGVSGREDFLAAQRAAYGPQLETYARIVAPTRGRSPAQVRLALYFPAMPRLLWWNAEG